MGVGVAGVGAGQGGEAGMLRQSKRVETEMRERRLDTPPSIYSMEALTVGIDSRYHSQRANSKRKAPQVGDEGQKDAQLGWRFDSSAEDSSMSCKALAWTSIELVVCHKQMTYTDAAVHESCIHWTKGRASAFQGDKQVQNEQQFYE